MLSEHSTPVNELATKAIRQALWLLQNKRRLYSFVIWESGTEEGSQIFEADSFQESLARAREYVQRLSGAVTRYVLVYDGYLKLEGKRHDAMYLEIGEAGNPQASLFAQEYINKILFRHSVPVGETIYLEPVKNLLSTYESPVPTGVWLNSNVTVG